MSFATIAQGSPPPPVDVASYLDTTSSAIVAPAGQVGISGFVFDIPREESVELVSDITEHYVESGSFINDHVVKKPIRITLSGYIGELVYSAPAPGSVAAGLAALQSALSEVDAYIGPLSPQAEQTLTKIIAAAQYAANQVAAIAKQASNVIKYFNGNFAGSSLQAQAFRKLEALWMGSQIVTVQTPWYFYPQMMIESISARQEEESEDFSDFTVVLKEVRFTDVEIATFDTNLFPPANAIQGAAATANGPTTGATVPDNESFLYALEHGAPPSGPLGTMFGMGG
ncbi:MAG: phage baseplate protein [Rectinemataceae bacterium]